MIFETYLSHSLRNKAMALKFENPICGMIFTRVCKLFPFDISNIWMKWTGNDNFHITNIMGWPREELDEAIPFSGLYGADVRLKSNCVVAWAVKLKLNVFFREHHFTYEVGSREKSKWFRFLGPASQETSFVY